MSDLEALADLLGSERVLLEGLVYRLLSLRSLLVAGEARFLTWAAQEVEDATDRVRAAELDRALVISRLAQDRGLVEEALTLAVLVRDADPPWRALLADHRSALVALALEVDDQASAVRRLARTTAGSLGLRLAEVGR